MMRSPPPADVPTLTDVVVLPASSIAATGQTAGELTGPTFTPALVAQIDALVAQRLAAALDSAWRQMLPTLIDATRSELASSLHEVIDSAVAEQSAGHRDKGLSRSIPAGTSRGPDASESAGLPR